MTMKKVFCPVVGMPTWANLVNKSKEETYRCTKCGTVGHSVSKG